MITTINNEHNVCIQALKTASNGQSIRLQRRYQSTVNVNTEHT